MESFLEVSHGFFSRTDYKNEETPSVRGEPLGDFACRHGFPVEMSGVQSSDYGAAEESGERFSRIFGVGVAIWQKIR